MAIVADDRQQTKGILPTKCGLDGASTAWSRTVEARRECLCGSIGGLRRRFLAIGGALSVSIPARAQNAPILANSKMEAGPGGFAVVPALGLVPLRDTLPRFGTICAHPQTLSEAFRNPLPTLREPFRNRFLLLRQSAPA